MVAQHVERFTPTDDDLIYIAQFLLRHSPGTMICLNHLGFTTEQIALQNLSRFLKAFDIIGCPVIIIFDWDDRTIGYRKND